MNSIIKKAKAGNKDSFLELIELVEKKLYVIARLRLNSEEDVKDVMQETIMQIYKSINKLKKLDSFNAWATAILINNCNLILRKKSKNITTSFEEIEDYYLCEDEYIDLNNNMDFFTLIHNLKDEEKTLICMYYSNGYTTKEISKILNINENTIRTKIARIKVKIKESIENERKNK